jgi:predicted Zn-ribbon and HTH transcriptional regulator
MMAPDRTLGNGGRAWAAPQQATCESCGGSFTYRNHIPAKWCPACRPEMERERWRRAAMARKGRR